MNALKIIPVQDIVARFPTFEVLEGEEVVRAALLVGYNRLSGTNAAAVQLVQCPDYTYFVRSQLITGETLDDVDVEKVGGMAHGLAAFEVAVRRKAWVAR